MYLFLKRQTTQTVRTMKTTLTLQAPTNVRKLSVKKLPIKVIIFLTSSDFFIFVSVIANIICWWGNIVDNMQMVGWGGLLFLTGFTPWAWRETVRNMRRPERFK